MLWRRKRCQSARVHAPSLSAVTLLLRPAWEDGRKEGGRGRPSYHSLCCHVGGDAGRPITPRGACLLAMPPDVMWDTERATHHWSARLTDEARGRINNARLQFAIKPSDSRVDAFMRAAPATRKKASKPSIRALKAIINCGAGRHSDTALEAGGVAQLCNASRRSLVVDWGGLKQLFTCEASISLGV